MSLLFSLNLRRESRKKMTLSLLSPRRRKNRATPSRENQKFQIPASTTSTKILLLSHPKLFQNAMSLSVLKVYLQTFKTHLFPKAQ